MILVRDVFQLQFGKAREARALLTQGLPMIKRAGASGARLLTDVTGDYYTFVLESTYPDLTAWEKMHQSAAGLEEWQKIYRQFAPLVQSGRREIFSIVE